jgi:hypothetical protein
MSGACNAQWGEMRIAYNILFGEPGGKRSLEEPRRRWENNIKIDFRKIRWESVDCINVAQDRDRWRALANTIMNLRVRFHKRREISGGGQRTTSFSIST